MALVEANVAVAVTGAVSVGATSATAPTSQSGTLTGFTDLGYISEDGVTLTSPGAGDAEVIKAWQNGATVRTLRSPSEDLPTYSFTLIETNKASVEFSLGVTLTQTATEGSYEIDSTDTRADQSMVLDIVDGAQLERHYLPLARVVEVGDRVYSNGEAIGYEVTVEAQRDSTKGYNVKVWSTRLRDDES